MILLALLLAFDVAITFDDLPAHGSHPAIDHVRVARDILAALEKHHVPQAYGFVNGQRLEGHPELQQVLDAWRAAGYPLGNHSFSHPSASDTPFEAYVADIARNDAYGKLFRYPFLYEGETPQKRDQIRAWLREHGYKKADVTIDFDDWAWNPPWARCSYERHDEVALGELRKSYLDAAVRLLGRYRELGRRLAGREVAHVLLMHVGAADAGMLDWMLSSYEAAGARWVPLEQAQADPIYAEDPGWVTKWGPTLLDRLAKTRGVTLENEWWPDEERLKQLCQTARPAQ